MKLNNLQRYWSLNGSFEALHLMMEAIKQGEVTGLVEMKEQIVHNMQMINKLMSELEVEINQAIH